MDHVSLIKEAIREGTLGLLPAYYRDLHEDDATLDERRRAIEMGLKVLGVNEGDRRDNLPSISWTINGCTVSMDVQRPQAVELVEDVSVAAAPVPVKPSEPTEIQLQITQDLLADLEDF